MGISNNAPTMSYIHISGTSVVWNNETYMVQDFATNKKYIYWNADTPHQLNASNVMPNRSTKQYLVIVNDNGMHSLVPSTSEDFSISFEGNSNQAIKDRIFGLYEKNEEFGDKFVAIEQDIDGIRSIVGETDETIDGTLIDRISNIEQRADEINLSVEEVSKKYNDDKEINELRENLNSSVIKLNSALGTFKSELTDYFKNNEISSEEKTKIKTQLETLANRKVTLEGYVNTVRLIAESNNQTQDVIALDSAKKSLQTAHDNLHNNVTNAVIDNIITPTENTIIIDSFAKYNLKINELKNTCDDIIILGVGGVITEELANISIKSNEIKLSVSKIENDFKNDMNLQKLELEGQINDVNSALGTFEETVNTTFKDGIIDETEKSLLKEKINLIDKEKVDIDLRYNSIISDSNLSKEVKTELITKYNDYCNSHNKLKERIDSVISDSIVNDAEKIEIDTLFETYSNALAYFSTLMNKAIENISFNSSKAELEQAKNELNDSINGVKDSIEGIDNILDGTFENNILDEVERENIKQNLKNLSKEKLDIDKIYTDLYNNTYLLNQDKINLKNAYDNYISKYNNVVKVSNDILAKEELVNNIDKANIDSAIANHNEALALFHVQANKSIDVISTNRINGAKSEINEDIENLKGDINGLNDYIDESFKDNVLSEAEKSAIKQNLKILETNKLNIDKQYSTVYNNTSLIGSAKTDLKNAYDNYILKYNSLINVINNILNKEGLLIESDNTAINNAFKEHNNAMSIYSEKVNKAIDSIALKNVENAKKELSKEIGELNNSLGDLEDTMNGAFKDGILSESEKQSINQHLLTVSSKKTDIDKRYATLYANEYLEGEVKTNLTTAYNNYIQAYNSLVTVINNILEKEGLIDDTDKNNLDNAFKEHNNKLGLYSTADLNALDYIASKKAESESEKVDKKYAEILLNEDGIVSKVGRIETTVNEQGTTINKHESSINQMATSIESKVSAGDIASTINQTAQSVRIKASKVDLDGYATFTNLSTPGQTTIDGGNIKTGTIYVDQLNSNNPNPIIRLFGDCSIDATLKNEIGQGNSIRLKADRENYIKVQPTGYKEDGTYIGAHTAIYSGLYPNHEVMIFQGNAHWGKIWTTQGIISTHGDNVYYGRNGNTTDKRLLNSSNLSNSVSSTASTVATSNAVKQAYDKAVQAYNIGNHSHPYASASHNHYGEYIYLDQLGVRALGNGGSILMHSSLDGNNKNLGYSGSKFNQVSAKAVWGDTGSWSDKRTKENIRYLDNENVVDTKYSNDNITKLELFEFIKTLKMCEYNYKEEFKSYQNDKIGFIANDVIGDKIGDKIVTEHEGYLTYNLNNMLFTTIGALQEEIKIREEENKQLRERLDNIEKILSDRK